VSGIATKTSFAMFLLRSITNCGVLAGEAHNTKVLVFSVTGQHDVRPDYLSPVSSNAETTRSVSAG